MSLGISLQASVGGNQMWPRGTSQPASWPQEGFGFDVCLQQSLGEQGLTTGASSQPGPVGLLPTHIMRSHFSNAFVRPQWCPHPPDKAAFVSWCQNNHLPKMMARLRNSLALSLGNRKKKRERESVKCLTWIDEFCWNYWIKWKLS